MRLNNSSRLIKVRKITNISLERNSNCGKSFTNRYRIYDKSLQTKFKQKDFMLSNLNSFIHPKIYLKNGEIFKFQNIRNRIAVRKRNPTLTTNIWKYYKNILNYSSNIDNVSQWSIPLDVIENENNNELNECRHKLFRSQSLTNFEEKFRESASYFQSSDFSNDQQTTEIVNVNVFGVNSQEEPHLNYYIGCPRETHDNSSSDILSQLNETIINNHLKDEDNIFDGLCQSGKVCCDNSECDLLFCTEIQRSDIAVKAFNIYINYYRSVEMNKFKSRNNEDITQEVEKNWNTLTQKEKLPFLLQAYISDYMSSSVLPQ